MYGPPEYYGPPDPVIPWCPCGDSYEDCIGECYEWSLTQLAHPDTGELLGDPEPEEYFVEPDPDDYYYDCRV